MFLSVPEVERLLRHVRRHVVKGDERARAAARTDRLIIECLLFSGLRNSELCGIRTEDLKTSRSDSTIDVRGRGGRIDRTILVPRTLATLWREYVAEVRPSLARRSGARSRALFLNERGNTYDRTALYRRVVRILTEAGLGERASVQLLRHTYGYLAYLRTGGNLLFVQRQLGHAHPMVTAIYAQFVHEDYAAMAERIATTERR
jgi:integrase/recombinase XerD